MFVVVLLVAGLWPVRAVPETVIEAPDTARQGEVLPVTISSASTGDAVVTGATVQLTLTDGSRHSSAAWRAAGHAQSSRTAWVALLGVPSTASLGTAELVVRFTGQDGGDAGNATPRVFLVQIEDGQFRSERIALNQAMSDLRTSDDPRRAEQSRVLWELIHRMNTEVRIHSGRFRLPVTEFRETSFFGDRREFAYSDGEFANSIHNGWDLAAPTGTPVVVPAGGRVVMVEERIITGLSVVLEHLPGVFSLYYHLDSIEVSLGEIVPAGSSLGTVGSTGLSTGPHLHWELRVSGVAVDPRVYLTEPLVDTASLVRSLSVVP